MTQRGESVALIAREISLIEYFAQHRGCVVTREKLYEHLFDEKDESLSNLLDLHVSNVRKKLGHEFISTEGGGSTFTLRLPRAGPGDDRELRSAPIDG